MNEKLGKHQRHPWTDKDPEHIIVHCRWDQLKGTFRASKREMARGTAIYERAKRQFDQEAAADLVKSLINPSVIDRLIDAVLAANLPPLIIIPHPEYDPHEPPDDPLKITNALPFAMAAYIAAELGCDIDSEIIEVARPGRTKLTRFPRFLWQPRFEGAVCRDRAYILADDNCSLGGTFAMLRSHIVANGGTVIGVTALSNTNGADCRFPIAKSTFSVLLSAYGTGIANLWKEEIGHDIQSLTEGEALFLADWGEAGGHPDSLLRRLRDRVAKARSQAR